MRITPDAQERRHWLVLRLGVAALALQLLTLPLNHVTALRSASFALAVLCAGLLFRQGPRQQARELPLPWLFPLWLAAALLSLNASPHALLALELIWEEVVKGALIFYSAYFIARSRQNGTIWFFSAAAALSLLASASIGAWLLNGAWQAVGPVPALGDYNASALILFSLVALPAFSLWRQRLGSRAFPVAVISTVLAMMAGMLTLSRAFWLVTAVMLLCATLVWGWKKKRQRQTSVLWLTGGLCVLALFATLVAHWRGFDLLFFDTRSVIYGPVLAHLREVPLTGFGYGHESLKAWYIANMQEAGVFHAHNLVLSYAEQMGLPGVLTVFGIFGGLSLRFFHGTSDPDPYRASLATLGLALVAGVFVKNNLDIFFIRHNLLLFFLCCGLLLGSVHSAETVPAREAEAS